MELKEEDRDWLVSLRQHPGWSVLMGLLEENEARFTDAMVAAREPEALHALAEEYRYLRSMRELLKDNVEGLAAALEEQRRTFEEEQPLSMQHAWLLRQMQRAPRPPAA